MYFKEDEIFITVHVGLIDGISGFMFGANGNDALELAFGTDFAAWFGILGYRYVDLDDRALLYALLDAQDEDHETPIVPVIELSKEEVFNLIDDIGNSMAAIFEKE